MELAIPISITTDTLTNEMQNHFHETTCSYLPRHLIPIGNVFLSITFISVFLLLPLIEIVIGVVFIDDCSLNIYIPIYLVFAGFISLICLVFIIIGWVFVLPLLDNFKWKSIRNVYSNARITSKILFFIAICFVLFGLSWFIAGNVWFYTSQSKVQYTNSLNSIGTYCHRTLYWTVFWSIVIKYAFVWMIVCRLNCYLCVDIQRYLEKHKQKMTISVGEHSLD